MDSYIQRFERYARASQWRVEDWATTLGALLTGKALESYSRLSEEDAVNYNELKNTLLRRYNLTEDGKNSNKVSLKRIKPLGNLFLEKKLISKIGQICRKLIKRMRD